MESFLLKQLPHGCKRMIGISIDNNSYDVNQFVNQIGTSWAATKKHRTPSSKTASTETNIELILACDANEGECRTLSIESSTTLKVLFNDYAKKRGGSLRSLRFSYRGKTLFLSSVGNKTPDQLNMKDQDVITVHVTGASRETGGKRDPPALQKSKTIKNLKTQTKKTKGKKKKKSNQEQSVKTPQDWEAEHSNKLSKVHEEVHQRLKKIRTRLNAFDLKRQCPKQKRKNTKKTKAAHTVNKHQILPLSGVGGKAGKSSFSVQVGEVQNLYKTTNKPSGARRKGVLLDLHGRTREEALLKLDESLPTWVEMAMQGLYPFVMPVRIVCGGGGQILSETLEKWIREHAQVANAMKNMPQ